MDTVTVYAPGHLDYYDSYGLLAIQLLRHLDAREDVHVNAIALGDAQHDSQPADVAAITARPIRASVGGIVLGYPTGYARHGPLLEAGPTVAVTMFESSVPPAGWVEALNRVDAVVVPSSFCRDSFTAAGVTVPSHVVPLGVSETYRPQRRPADRRPFTFLAWGDRGRRKGVLLAIHAFHQAFGDDPAYRLLIKARDLERRVDITNDNIDIIYRDMSERDLYRLYLDCDCMAFPTRGEGFGLPPREFAATGAPAIATDWGGTADDVDEWGIPLDCGVVPADWRGSRTLEGHDLGVWAEPDVPHLEALMKDVAARRETYLDEAYARAGNVRSMYSWRAFTEGVYEVWQQVSEVKRGNIVPAPAIA